MSKTEFAARLGWDRGYLYRRLNGETPLDVADLDNIEKATRIRADYLIGEHEPKLNPPPGGGHPFDHPEASRGKKKPTEDYQSLDWVA